MSAPSVAEEPEADFAVPPLRGGLHRPVRALVALAELIGAAVAILLAFLCWHRGVTPVTLVLDDGTRLEAVRNHGGWLALGIVLGTVAALLVLDAGRQVVLAVRARPRRPRATPAPDAEPAVPNSM
ncbi:MAG TPA: hypothetical protein VGX25_08845 [Actinophytocola sp.]|uniref:hypothetical protein n=1 Tax=Actinophytocola sp. TaxID=1872138 RepID=UPI002DDD7D34|nr:hypothetical protein [Actinophytocola sp.]HEV2779495.1 hypothetical protein [Actinophytocola sp.]